MERDARRDRAGFPRDRSVRNRLRGDRDHQSARDHGALGIEARANPSVARSSGKIAEPRRSAKSSNRTSNSFESGTGLVLDPYFSGTKLTWLLRHDERAKALAQSGELAFGTIDSWLVCKLSGGAVHITDVTNASRTLMFDIHRRSWDAELCDRLEVQGVQLPEVRSCSEVYAKTKGVPGLPDGIPIAGIAGDQQAALFGQVCFEVGEAKCTYGTGAFLLMNTGPNAMQSKNGLISTIAWQLGSEITYALEGSSFIAGAAVQWLRDGLGLIQSAEEIERLAQSVQSSGDVVFVPALTGLGAPHWEPHARGLIAGITRDTTKAHLARATLEGIAFQIADLAAAMTQDAGGSLRTLRVDGGAASNDLLMQFQADLLDVAVVRPTTVETTALGAGLLAGLAVGYYESLDTVRQAYEVHRVFEPSMDAASRSDHITQWRLAVRRTLVG